jgi:hypothetical protein
LSKFVAVSTIHRPSAVMGPSKSGEVTVKAQHLLAADPWFFALLKNLSGVPSDRPPWPVRRCRRPEKAKARAMPPSAAVNGSPCCDRDQEQESP